ncbi:hypothetical protein N7462_002870 [Penicillium macrosclerotiorum]|uniref:uncharacterized protein n=1 Tax=Penicillium macrosclerotiorum TaxID=303699 RepID=UPI0025499580|nr:uncharacterized protein N7462_002870 [Penicillium macrosclerotiorum]KAJ5693447.1 hypothetical protein N7462_002870 [Penicillium macrosclerotiorum]
MAPLLSRKSDCIYLLFFATHVPIIFLIDTVPLQPAWLQTDLSGQLRDFYITNYRDKFFEFPAPGWFNTFIWMELLYHVPASLWAVWGLIKDHPLVPVHLLVFGIQAFVTSITCLVDVWSWPDRSVAEKQQLTTLYGPYVALGEWSQESPESAGAFSAPLDQPTGTQLTSLSSGAWMAFDMVTRLRARLLPKCKHE